MAGAQRQPWLHGPPWSPTGYAPVGERKREGRGRDAAGKKTTAVSRKAGYRPLAHRTLWLALLGTVILALIGLLEYSLHVLPQASFDMSGEWTNLTQHSKRQVLSSTRNSTSTTVSTVADTTTRTSPSGASSFTPAVANSAADGGSATGATAPAVIGVASPPEAASTPAPVPVSQATPISFHPPLESTSAVAATTNSAPSSEQGPTVLNSQPSPPSTEATELNTAPAIPTLVTSPSATSSPRDHTPTTGSKSTSAATASNTANPTRASQTLLPSSSPRPNLDDSALASPVPLSLVQYPGIMFIGVYGPILIAIFVRLLTHYLYRSTKLVDPFVMLSRAEGASFDDFFWSDHLGSEGILAPFHALRSKRWAVLGSLAVYYAAQLLAPFASELNLICLSSYQPNSGNPSGLVKGLALWVGPTIVRILQGILGLIFVLLVVVWFLLRPGRVPGNPASVGVMASLVGHVGTTDDFSRAARMQRANTIKEQFAGQKYKMEIYTTLETNVDSYGIVSLSNRRVGSSHESSSQLAQDASTIPFYTNGSRSTWSYMKQNDILNLVCVTVFSMALFGLILTYASTAEAPLFEQFMESGSFGPRFLLTVLVLILRSPLLSLCARATASVPFSRLASRPRCADMDLLHPVPLTPLGSIGYTLRRGQWYAVSLSVTAGLVIELLLVLIPGVPYEPHETWVAARTSWLGCLACLGLILLITVVCWARLLFRRDSSVYEWPYTPTSVGAVAMYVAGSNMSMDAATSARLSFRAKGALYQFSRQDSRWLVDYAERVTTPEQAEQALAPRHPTPVLRDQGAERAVDTHRKSSSTEWRSYHSQHGSIASASLTSLHEFVATHRSEG